MLGYMRHEDVSQMKSKSLEESLTLIELHKKLLELLFRLVGGLDILH